MNKIAFTAPKIEKFVCPADKEQAFLWDQKTNGLGLRATPRGRPAFVFQAPYLGKDIRITIGSPSVWTIEDARSKARELQREIDAGRDPRDLKRNAVAAQKAAKVEAEANAMTVEVAWSTYLAERRPFWRDRTYDDHVKLAAKGGQPRKRMPGVLTKPGPLAHFMQMRLVDLTTECVEQWAEKESCDRPARVRLGLRLLKAFLRWTKSQPELKGRIDLEAASSKKAREIAGAPALQNDCLQREQLPAWFKHVRAIPNPAISAYLQCLLLIGPRREELAALRWDDVDLRWNGLRLRDKIDPTRQTPLTPYVKSLLLGLPRRNEWVFCSPTSESGHLENATTAHYRACEAAGIELTLHGLRRSFATLSEWLDVPSGISAQIQGHAPQGVREQKYIRRPLDLLRHHHQRIEAWILEQGQVDFTPPVVSGLLTA